MSTHHSIDLQTYAVVDRTSLRLLLDLSGGQRECLARIARTYEEYICGRCDEARVIEVVRQQTERAANLPRQARRRSRPVRG